MKIKMIKISRNKASQICDEITKKKNRSLHIFCKPLLPFSYANTVAN